MADTDEKSRYVGLLVLCEFTCETNWTEVILAGVMESEFRYEMLTDSNF